MSLRKEQCNKVCRILDDVLANRPTERDSLILAVRKAFAEPQEHKTGKWIEEDGIQICSCCGDEHDWQDYRANYCENCGAKMEVNHESN